VGAGAYGVAERHQVVDEEAGGVGFGVWLDGVEELTDQPASRDRV